eukprot:sb/3467604/
MSGLMAYFIFNPLTYDRKSSLKYLIVATCVVWGIHLPIMICHYFPLFPENMKATLVKLGFSEKDFEETIIKNKFPYYEDEYYRFCARHWVVTSIDEIFLVLNILVLNCTAFGLTVAAFFAITRKIYSSRRTFGNRDDAESQIRTRRQNTKLLKRSVIVSSFTLLPWLPNFFVTIFSTVASLVAYGWYVKTVKVPWIFPLLNLLMEPNIRKGIKAFKSHNSVKFQYFWMRFFLLRTANNSLSCDKVSAKINFFAKRPSLPTVHPLGAPQVRVFSITLPASPAGSFRPFQRQ